MTSAVNRFFGSIENHSELSQASLIEFFVYFLTVELGLEIVTPKEVEQCFRDCDLDPPKATAARLSEGVKSRPQRYLRANGGYKLQRFLKEAISKKLGAQVSVSQTSASLRSLELRVPGGKSREFLNEAIDCFEVGANRATVILIWILTLNHLFEYIQTHRLADFNEALAKNTDRRVKVSKIETRDDFNDIPEGKFIELCRSASIISNDVRKILDQKLETRNSCAHPSGVKISRSKAIEVVEDLIENVVLKY